MRLETARSAISSGVAEVITRILSVAMAIMTARNLEPHDVGLLGVAVIVTGLISIVGCYPVTACVAIRDEKKHNVYALAAFFLDGLAVVLLLGVLAGTFSLLCQSVVGDAKVRTQFQHLIFILVWIPILECVGSYPQVILQRRLDLRFLALIQVIQAALFVVLSMILLLMGRGYIGVAVASLISTAAALALQWYRLWFQGWFGFEGWPAKSVWRKALLDSGRVFLGGFGGYLGSRLDNLLVAGAMGPAAMSYYSMAWTASRTPTGILSKAITFVLIPTFARLQNEAERVERGLKECLQFSYVALAPICALMLVCAPDLVTITLGARWAPMISALRLMSITVLVAPVLDASNALLVGTGRAQFSVVAAIARILALFMLMTPMAHRWGLRGAVWADLISAVASTAALVLVVRSVVEHVSWPVISVIGHPILAALCAAMLAWVLGRRLDAGYVRFITEVGILAISYPVVLGAVGGRRSLLSLVALLHNALLNRVPMAEANS